MGLTGRWILEQWYIQQCSVYVESEGSGERAGEAGDAMVIRRYGIALPCPEGRYIAVLEFQLKQLQADTTRDAILRDSQTRVSEV